MNCDRCPHMKAIRKALAPCANCDAGRLHNTVHVDSHSFDWANAQRRIDDHEPSTGVTALDPDVEDELRKLTATLFQLDPVELLLVQHVSKRGSYASFAKTLDRLNSRLRSRESVIDGRKGGFRQLAWTWIKSIKRKVPELSKFLDEIKEER